MIALDARAGQKCFDATSLPAKARRAWPFVVVGPRQRIMSPLTRDCVGSCQHAPAHDDARTDTGAENDPEDDFAASPCTVGRLR
jgi:hypothetical protein